MNTQDANRLRELLGQAARDAKAAGRPRAVQDRFTDAACVVVQVENEGASGSEG